ncbi:MAG: glycosyltransferase [Planctomycetes bacterium]|nr:glycosyltransferase [Planctomycetota bacterium]
MATPDVSLVIPVRNGGPRLRRVLERVRAQKSDLVVEPVVIDSRSSDGSDDAARRAGFRVLTVDPRDFNHGATRDTAIAATSGRAIVLLVQDALPVDERWLEALAAPLLADPDAAGSFSRQVAIPGGNPILEARLAGWIAGLPTARRAQLDPARPWETLTPFERLELVAFDNVSSCIRRDLWRIHPFGHRPFGEDLGWSTFAIRAGYAIRFEPASVVEHSHDRSAWHEARRIYCDHRNLHRLLGLRTVPTFAAALAGRRGALAHYLALIEKAGLPPDQRARRRRFAHAYAWGEALAQWLAPLVNEHGERGLLGLLDAKIRRGI